MKLAKDDQIFTTLLERAKEDKLAHFYIIRPPLLSAELSAPKITHQWIKKFLAHIISHETKRSLEQAEDMIKMGHSDVLWLAPNVGKNYSLEDESWDLFRKFIEFKSLELSRQFIIFDQAQKISTIIANKLLKDLESPHNPMTIFFITQDQSELLATIRSRAIELKLQDLNKTQDSSPLSFISSSQELKAYLQHKKKNSGHNTKALDFFLQLSEICQSGPFEKHLSHALELLGKLKIEEDELIQLWLEIEGKKKTNFKQKSAILNSLQWTQEARTYNNRAQARYQQYLTHLFQF